MMLRSDEQQISESGDGSGNELFQRLGQLTRMLRVNIRGLGLQHEMEEAAKVIPDTMSRLDYVASMTEQSAQRVLNAVDRTQPLQESIQEGAQTLDLRWDGWLENPLDLEQARALALETQCYLKQVPVMTQASSKELLEITMAQDFQDLTGQVIKKMNDVMQSVEHQLLGILVDSVADEKHRDELRQKVTGASGQAALLNGPQIDPSVEGVVSGQDQVDDLLDELGF